MPCGGWSRDVLSNGRDVERIDERTLSAYLYTAGQPDPDLLIRTSGEMRISNFLLWQIAYAEIWVTEVLWPDFRRRHLSRPSRISRSASGGTAGSRPLERRSAANLARRVGTALVALPRCWRPSSSRRRVSRSFSSPWHSSWACGSSSGSLEAATAAAAAARGRACSRSPSSPTCVPGLGGPPVWPLAALLLLGLTLLPGRELTERIPAAAGTLLGAVYLGALGGTLAGLRAWSRQAREPGGMCCCSPS